MDGFQTALEHVGILLEFQLIRCEHVVRQVGVVDKVADVPYALEFQVVDGHDALGAPVEAVGGKGALEENGDQSGDQRQCNADCHQNDCRGNRQECTEVAESEAVSLP